MLRDRSERSSLKRKDRHGELSREEERKLHKKSRRDEYDEKTIRKSNSSVKDYKRTSNENGRKTTIKTEIKEEPKYERSKWDEDYSRPPKRHREEEPADSRIQWGKPEDHKPPSPPVEKAKVNMGLSGKLTEDANTYNGVVIKYAQPTEARKPKRRWRWYIFKGSEELPFLPIHRQSAYLIGRERRVADVPIDHPSCSKQHAVLQYRLVKYTRPDGSMGKTVKPYVIDLGSANGTYVNNKRIDSSKYVELLERDVVKFGYSSREYVLLHEGSHNSDYEDDGDAGLDMSPVSALLSAQK